MLITWTPPGGDARTFTFRVEDLTPDLYEPIEQVGPWDNLDDFLDAVMGSNRRAWRVALWTCMRRDDGDPGLTLDAVQPKPGELAMRYEPEEELLMCEAALLDPGLTLERRAYWEGVLPGLRAAVGKEPAPDSGAVSVTGDAPTGGTSPTSAG